MFLNDQETSVDLLYYESVAKTVVRLVRSTPSCPVTIGVHGDWGAGKSSVLRMTSDILTKDQKTLCLWFNGWTFEGFEDAKTVVIETIVEELLRARPGHEKVAAAAKKVFKRIDWLKVAKKTGGYAFTAATGIPTFDQLSDISNIARALFEKSKEDAAAVDLQELAEKAGELVKDKDEPKDNVAHQMHEFRKEFEELIKAAEIDQLIVLVDDLDRCLPQTAIATLEAIRLFLFVPRTAFVIGADEMMIEYAVRSHFPDLPAPLGQVPYARNYLEKLIQVPFRIPALGVAETRIYVILLLAQAALGDGNPEFNALLGLARRELKKPWATRGLDAVSVTGELKAAPSPQLAKTLATGAHISKILAEGTKGNPRQIKRFLNSVLLRMAVAEERGFADELDQERLAKVMLAESFSPNFYTQLARMVVSAADGRVEALRQFEATAGTPGASSVSAAKPAKEKAPPAVQAPEVEEWLKSDTLKEWAQITPALGDVDLRPYVFATRDKRSYLGGLAAAGHLEVLLDQLQGGRMAAQKLAAELAKLSGTEPESLLNLLQTAILGVQDLGKEPPLIHGLVALVKAHPNLQSRVSEFLATLPTNSLGAWAATNFSSVQTAPEAAQRYRALLTNWSQQTNNETLRRAAASALPLLDLGKR